MCGVAFFHKRGHILMGCSQRNRCSTLKAIARDHRVRAEDTGMPPELLTFRACRTWKSLPGKASDQPRTQRHLSTYVQEGAGVLDTRFPAATHVHCRNGLDDLEKGGTKVGHIMPSPSPHSRGVLIG